MNSTFTLTYKLRGKPVKRKSKSFPDIWQIVKVLAETEENPPCKIVETCEIGVVCSWTMEQGRMIFDCNEELAEKVGMI